MAMKGNSFMHRVAELIVKLRWVFIILFVAAHVSRNLNKGATTWQ